MINNTPTIEVKVYTKKKLKKLLLTKGHTFRSIEYEFWDAVKLFRKKLSDYEAKHVKILRKNEVETVLKALGEIE